MLELSSSAESLIRTDQLSSAPNHEKYGTLIGTSRALSACRRMHAYADGTLHHLGIPRAQVEMGRKYITKTMLRKVHRFSNTTTQSTHSQSRPSDHTVADIYDALRRYANAVGKRLGCRASGRVGPDHDGSPLFA
jgi:hypothetical protein